MKKVLKYTDLQVLYKIIPQSKDTHFDHKAHMKLGNNAIIYRKKKFDHKVCMKRGDNAIMEKRQCDHKACMKRETMR